MKRALAILVLGMASVVARAAEFAAVNGSVEVKKAGAARWGFAKSGAAVAAGDTVRTGIGANAEVRMGEGHKVTLREKSALRFDSVKKGSSLFFLEVGKMRAKVNKLKPGTRFEVKTPLAVAAVRGTEFELNVAEDKTSTLSVLEGRVSYRDLVGGGPEILVPQGQTQIFKTTPVEPKAPETTPQDKEQKGEKRKDDGQVPPKNPEDEKGRGEKGEKKEKVDEKKAAALKERLSEKKEEEAKEKAKEEEKGASVRKVEDVRLAKLETFFEKEALKQEFVRETDQLILKDAFQTDVVQNLKEELRQEGRVMIDAFGRRVRLEEFIKRSADDRHVTQIFLAHREGRDDMVRYDVYASGPLPKDLREVNLFGTALGETKMDLYAVATDYMVSRGDHYVREWKDGGLPQPQYDAKGQPYMSVVFSHWFVEAKGAGESPVLLSHWVPGSYDAHSDIYGSPSETGNIGGDGAADVPEGYANYLDPTNEYGVIGDDRPIVNYGLEDRGSYFDLNSEKIRSIYARSEGFDRNAQAYFNDKPVDLTGSLDPVADLAAWQNKTTKRSVYSDYLGLKGETVVTMIVDEYYVADEGTVYPFGKVGPTVQGFAGLNREEVYRTSLGKLDIDVIHGPTTFRRSGPATVEE